MPNSRESGPALSAVMLNEDVDCQAVALTGCLLKYAIVAALQEASRVHDEEVELTAISRIKFQELPMRGELVHFYCRSELNSRGSLLVSIDLVRRDESVGSIVAIFSSSQELSQTSSLLSVA